MKTAKEWAADLRIDAATQNLPADIGNGEEVIAAAVVEAVTETRTDLVGFLDDIMGAARRIGRDSVPVSFLEDMRHLLATAPPPHTCDEAGAEAFYKPTGKSLGPKCSVCGSTRFSRRWNPGASG